MIYIVLNIVPIMAATALGLVIAALWRGAGGLAAPRPGRIVLAALALFWFAAILAGALILAPPKADPWVMAIASAVVIWIGFVAPALIVTQAWRGQPARAVIGDALCWLAIMIAQAAVMKAIGLVAPPAA